METFQVKPASIPFTKMRNSVLIFGTVCCALYIGFLLLFKVLGLMHITELRFANYLILSLVCFWEIKRWVKMTHGYVPFLQVLGTALFTGIWSFILFSAFLYVYSKFDLQLAQLFEQTTKNFSTSLPTIVILFEGAAASIIVAFINMQYFRRYEEGENSPDEK